MEQPTDRSEASGGPLSAADRFAQALGLRLVELEQGRAVVEMMTTAEHCNDLGKVHGGALFSLADGALAAAANSRSGELAVGISGTVHFLRPVGPGECLRAEAIEERRGGRLGSYRIVVSHDGKPVATALASTMLVGSRPV
ncbi:MAG: hotdog fold thioesterase [Actinobacteria bacterium]|nr:hotdog fold thioesterase [Actinomycetota bacterium]